MDRPDLVYIGIAGTVLALDRRNGEEVWRTKLRGDFVNVAMHGGDLFATAAGELYSLDPQSGKVLWKNQLRGLGHGLVTIAGPCGQTAVLQKKNQDDDASAPYIAGAVG
jgi:hypothetical protein